MKKRKYRQRKRAELQGQTRERIIEATMALHEEVGPAQTSIKAVAERAGVQRLTVYRHFPDEQTLFHACTSHWLVLNPPPRAEAWRELDERQAKIQKALLCFFQYYRATEQMWLVSYRDLSRVAALAEPMADFESYVDQVAGDLLKGCGTDDMKYLWTTLRHGLSFSTWQSLKRFKLNDKRMAQLVGGWLDRSNVVR